MQKYDVAVIGGGLVGCASAYYLSQSGADVILLERGQINEGASGRNAGSLHFQLEQRLVKHRQELAEALEHYVALTQIAIDHWRNIEQELNCDLEVVMEGGFMVAETDDETRLLEEKSAIEKAQGLTVELLERKDIHKLAPYLSDKVQAALFCPHEGHCNPRLLTPAYARGAAANKVEILTNKNVTGLYKKQGRWQIKFTNNQINKNGDAVIAEMVLNAAGVWANEVGLLASVDLPLLPVGLIMNVTEKIPKVIHHLIQHVGRKLSMKQVNDGNVLIGGGWLAKLQHQDGKWHSERPALIHTDTVKENLRTAASIVPFVRDLHLIRTWTGMTALAPDQLPILGAVDKASGFYIAAGGSAFTYGPTYARLISELILTSSTSFPIAPYAASRFQ